MGRGRKNKRKNKNNHGKKKGVVTKSQNEIPETSQRFSSNNIEELLSQKIELLYKIALERLDRKLGLRMYDSIRAILLNGSVFGEEINILNNILKNSLEVADDNDNLEPIFQDISELARYSMQTLINMIVHHQSKPTKKDAILFLLQSEFLSSDDSDDSDDDGEEEDDDDDDGDEDIVDNNGKEKVKTCASGKDIGIDLGNMLKQQKNTTVLHRRTNNTNSSSSNNSIPNTQHDPNLISDCLGGSGFKDWLFRVCGKDEKRDIATKLAEEVEQLEIKLNERKDWAVKTVLTAAKKVSDSGLLLQELRYERDILKEKAKIKEEDESSCSCYKLRLSERENFLKNLNCEIGVRNEVKREMEDMNRKYRSEIAAYDLNFSETQNSIVEAKKKERMMVKKCRDGEKVNEDLKRKIEEEKRKIEEMGKRQEELNRKNDAIERKLRQTKEEKEQARALVMEEKKLYKLAKENSKNRLAYVKHELDLKFRQSIDEEKRLELELSQLIKNQANSASSSSAIKANHDDDQYKYKYQRSKPCMICSEADVNVVFLPCAHQVICSNCNGDVYFALEDRCPCCNSFIQKRVKVFGPSD